MMRRMPRDTLSMKIWKEGGTIKRQPKMKKIIRTDKKGRNMRKRHPFDE